MACLESLWYWLAHPPTTQFHDALIAIASVSAVIWTGGLIARQLTNYMDVPFRAALEYVGFAFFAPMFGSFITGTTLRAAAAVFFIYYLYVSYPVYQKTQRIQRGEIATPPKMQADFVPQWKKNSWTYFRLSLLSNVAILVGVIAPCDAAIAWTSVLMDYLGYQLIIPKIFGLQQEFPQSASLLMILQRVSEIDERLKRVIPGVQPATSSEPLPGHKA